MYKNLYKILLALVVVITGLSQTANAQLPQVKLLSSTTVNASGSGTTGLLPTTAFNFPAGKNRMLVVTVFYERYSDEFDGPYPGGMLPPTKYAQFNFPYSTLNTDPISNIKYTENTISVNGGEGKLGTVTTYANMQPSTGPGGDPWRHNIMSYTGERFILTDWDGAGLPTASNVPISFGDVNTPKTDGDDVVATIELFENVSTITQTNKNWLAQVFTYQVGNASLGYDMSQTTFGTGSLHRDGYTPAASPFNTSFTYPIGRASSDVLYWASVLDSYSSMQSLSPSPDWTTRTNVQTVNTNGGNMWNNYNEPTGIGLTTATYHGVPTSFTSTGPGHDGNLAYRGHFGFPLMPLASPSISGTVVRDMDGSANINGWGTNGDGLYVYAIDADNKVVGKATVNSNGTFTIPAGKVVEAYTYRIVLSNANVAEGAGAPAATLNPGWTTVGEATGPTGNDGNPNGEIADVTIGTTNISGLLFGIRVSSYTISGTVVNDGNGLADNSISGNLMDNAAGKLYAYLLDNSGTIVLKQLVTSGAYSFTIGYGVYKVYVSSNAGLWEDDAPPTTAFSQSAGWNVSGVKNGDGTLSASNDYVAVNIPLGTADGTTYGVVTGLNQKPNAIQGQDDEAYQPAVGTIIPLASKLQGNDREDQPTTGSLDGKKVTITQLPTSGTLLYNGVAINSASTTATYDPANLAFQFTGSGYSTITFGFAYVDSDNIASDPATYTINIPYALPVHYGRELNASVQGSMVVLSWTTAQELNNKQFVVYRSTDSKNWYSIGVVNSYFADGNSNAGHAYSFTDNTTPEGTVYYYLKQVDKDGKTADSRVVFIVTGTAATASVTLYPVPVNNTLNVAHAQSGSQYRILSVDGKVLQAGMIQNDPQLINVGVLPASVYFIQVIDKQSKVTVLKFIKK